MRRMLPIYVAAGAALGVIVAYLLAGGASYKPLAAADPCEPRDLAVLAERGTLEGVALSALDGAACELQVTREDLIAALADEQALSDFSAEHGIDEARVEEAIRAGLVRAVDDAELAGLLSGPVAAVAGAIAENAPVGVAIDLFTAIPGDPSLTDLITGVGELGLDLQSLGDTGLDEIGGFLDEIGRLGGRLDEIPGLPDGAGQALGDLLPDSNGP